MEDRSRRRAEQDRTSIGTDGFGFSDTREAVRHRFGAGAESVTPASLGALAPRGESKTETVREAPRRYAPER
ncbi:hypothetical protein [Streptomyces sp. XH2]|uniref:hypothetical protein n=1 Tax=Streptomyces sp. XH2 TaxID=3412483 RepID=UPI003C7BC2C0